MNIYLDVQSPAVQEAGKLASDYGLQNHGLTNLRRVYWNLPTPALYEESVFRSEGRLTHLGPLAVSTGKHTARAAADKFVVREQTTEDKVWWGQYNRPFTGENFSALLTRLQGYLQGRDVFVQDCYAGADPEYSLPIRIITQKAWHSLFARTMFLKIRNQDALKKHVPEFTVIAVPGFPRLAADRRHAHARPSSCSISASGWPSSAARATPAKSRRPSSPCSISCCRSKACSPCTARPTSAPEGDVAIFFGLSGTGKTTLSADPKRHLIGDDEHGWSDNGVFNFEDGCYAKVIRLSPEAEPQIYACTRRFGTILENVTFDPVSRRLDLDDYSVTENTRAAYPLEYIENSLPEKRAGHPKNVIFLTCDASGVMPPIARLSPDQAIYHFISGYTSKIAGTEIGLGIEPEITFSTCFGGPFMVHHPYAYAELLKRKVLKHGAHVWLVNTGWTGGSFGVGKRISIHHTRALLNAALNGKLARGRVQERSGLRLRRPHHVRRRALRHPRSGQHLAQPRRVFQEVRRPCRALHRELQVDDGGVPGTYPGSRPQTPHPRPGTLAPCRLTALSLGEWVARDGAFVSRRGSGEGLCARKVLRAANRIPDQPHAFVLKLASKFKLQFLHDANRGRILRNGNGNDSFQPYPFKRISKRGNSRFRRQPATPVVASQPPSDLRVGRVAPKSHATKADHLSRSLGEQFPPTEASFRIELHLPFYEASDLVICPRHAARDVTHHFGVRCDGPKRRPI